MIVTLHRDHTYPSLEAVKEEVSGRAVELVQSGVAARKQVPNGNNSNRPIPRFLR